MQTHIPSFVIRRGRMSPRQKSGLAAGASSLLLRGEDGLFNPIKIFGRAAPLTLEIGFGMGKTLFEMAKAQPENNFLGIEVHPPGMGALFADVLEHGITNVRAYAEDAVFILQHCILDNSVDRIHIFFPDPWPKRRHHKRRLIQAEFVKLLSQKLKIGGVLHLATDWQEYAEHMFQILSQEKDLSNLSSQGFYWGEHSRPRTKFEERGLRLGHSVFDLMFVR